MAAPIIAGAGVFELRRLVAGDEHVDMPLVPILVGTAAAFVAGMAAVHFLLRYLRSHRYTIFVAYRLVAAAVVVIALLAR